ncbi:uncharacterized protein LY79DRAFT_515816 [Colletotrichum navitas]|uniref:Uncharacterized protein n=1 Tax=Colletotrichum navitas TaxID=681940 RepID=A0AAD8Q0C1_9PEZI|nr:uncharacterized protein LY79DRAFT_515816 [Colletotrichum navitas]KAK1590397.1 hypothetical protein LY79DRAFT_515816 [Colletotrichum navitas]
MSCDVRPVITSTKTLYVDPYETPLACSCEPPPSPSARGRSSSRRHSLAPFGRCPSHGCCTLDVAVHRCARRCRDPTRYNRYFRAPSASSRHDSYSVPSRQMSPSRSRSYPHSSPHPSKPLPSDPFAAQPGASSWRRLRTFDRDPDFCAVESRDFRFALAELLDIGRILLHAEAELDKARLRIERERARHRAAHGTACEGVLREWECAWIRRVADAVVGADDLALSSEVLADCWARGGSAGSLRTAAGGGGGVGARQAAWRPDRTRKPDRGGTLAQRAGAEKTVTERSVERGCVLVRNGVNQSQYGGVIRSGSMTGPSPGGKARMAHRMVSGTEARGGSSKVLPFIRNRGRSLFIQADRQGLSELNVVSLGHVYVICI